MLRTAVDTVAKTRVKHAVSIGVAEHGNSAVLLTIAADGELLDRRRIELAQGLPTHPYRHEGSWAVGRYLDSSWARPISLTEAVVLVERVQNAARSGARDRLEELATAVPVPIARVPTASSRSVGPPWQAKHKLAAAAARAAGARK